MTKPAQTPRVKFDVQRIKARLRGIEWNLSFDEWMEIWAASGHWLERGRNSGSFVMARHGDVGPYAVGNVSIITTSQNISEATKKHLDLPMGVYPTTKGRFRAIRWMDRARVYLGTYDTPELAREAYDRAA